MSSVELVDNDILLKIACFDLLDGFAADFQEALPSRLGVATYVLSTRIKRSTKLRDKAAAHKRLATLLAWGQIIEPDEAEMDFAAEIEALVQVHNIPFDSGESILLAILLNRPARRLHTGDKRAIEGLPRLSQLIGKDDILTGRIRCFEQVLLSLLSRLGVNVVVDKVCREPEVDKTASICCRCTTGAPPEADEIVTGLQSYIGDLRRRSGSVLMY